MTPIRLEPIELVGQTVLLRPMEISDVDDLLIAGCDPRVWAFTLDFAGRSRDDMEQYVSTAIQNRDLGVELPFVQVHKESGKIIGSTRYHQTDPFSLEIGWTWIHPDFQRTRVNTESKYLLLCHAFDTLKAIRVQLKTDDRNLKSQNAIQRIGGKFEGVLRLDRSTWDGHRRSTHMFSILQDEWPDVKLNLERMLATP